jgi:competence ComEA-like helix-hairpin-helix protein
MRLLSLLPALVTACIGMASARSAHAQGKDLDGVVNLNTAAPDLLELLPGIGPAKVRSIIVYRQRRPFRTVDELVRIKGIGRKMVRRLRAHLAVAGPSTARAVHQARTAEPPRPPPPPAARPVTPAGKPPAVIRPAPQPVMSAGRPRPRPPRVADQPRAAANHCARPP